MNKEDLLKQRLERCQLLESKGYTYDQITGKIYGSRKNEITRKDWNGYIHIYFGSPAFNLAGHHFAWYMTHKNVEYEQIDHINGVRDDNRIENLRAATNQTNSFNRRKVVGYTWSKDKKKWCAKIKLNGITHNLGCHDSQFDARQDYLKAKKELHKI
jgi:hypothetical protein